MKNLPVILPDDIEFSGNGNPLKLLPILKEATCPCCGGKLEEILILWIHLWTHLGIS